MQQQLCCHVSVQRNLQDVICCRQRGLSETSSFFWNDATYNSYLVTLWISVYSDKVVDNIRDQRRTSWSFCSRLLLRYHECAAGECCCCCPAVNIFKFHEQQPWSARLSTRLHFHARQRGRQRMKRRDEERSSFTFETHIHVACRCMHFHFATQCMRRSDVPYAFPLLLQITLLL